jgi:hypothetical protein
MAFRLVSLALGNVYRWSRIKRGFDILTRQVADSIVLIDRPAEIHTPKNEENWRLAVSRRSRFCALLLAICLIISFLVAVDQERIALAKFMLADSVIAGLASAGFLRW